MTVITPMIYECGVVSEITTAFGGTVPDGVIGFETSTLNVYESISNAWNVVGPKVPVKIFGNPSRNINTIFQPSTTRDSFVTYSVPVSASSTLLNSASGTVTLQCADNVAFTTNVITLQLAQVSLSGVLATNASSVTLTAFIPAAKYAQLVASSSGTVTFGSVTVQEVQI